MILLKNARLVSELTEGYADKKADVMIDGQKISGIYKCGSAPSGDYRTIDIEGKVLLPGFIDLHTHLYFAHENISALAIKSPCESMIDSISFARERVEYGYTTLRDAGAAYNCAIAVRDGINRGQIDGPRIIASGRCITPTTRGNDIFGPLYREFDDPREAREVVRKEIAMGADFIKYMATGAVLNPGGDPGAMITTPEELRALVVAAEECGSYVAVHCHGKNGVLACVEAGIKTIEHATFADEECTQSVLDHGSKSAFIPTFAIVYAIKEGLVDGGVSKEVAEQIEICYEQCVKNMKYAYKHGVPMGWGTDIDQASYTGSPYLEYMARADMGLTQLQMLKQVTIDSAVIAGIDDVTGTIKVGKDADMIVMDGAPDEKLEDIMKKPVHTICRGKVLV